MSYYILKVLIASEDLKVIKDGKYNLCLTKNAKYHGRERQGNVVFSTVLTRDLAPGVQFVWEERYETYMSSSFRVYCFSTFNPDVPLISISR